MGSTTPDLLWNRERLAERTERQALVACGAAETQDGRRHLGKRAVRQASRGAPCWISPTTTKPHERNRLKHAGVPGEG